MKNNKNPYNKYEEQKVNTKDADRLVGLSKVKSHLGGLGQTFLKGLLRHASFNEKIHGIENEKN